MGKKYTTDFIEVDKLIVDGVQIDPRKITTVHGWGRHQDGGYKTTDTNTQLSDAQIAAMGYIKTYTDTNTNTQLSDAQIGAMGYIKTYTDTNTNTHRGIDNTPVNGQTAESISSNWAYDHAASSTAHPRDGRNQIAGSYLGQTAKASDSNLLDGLDLHTGRNNVANRVVRTNSSGYADFGWINTTSGGASGTPTRIYCSQDSYLRYYTPAQLAPYILNQGSTKNSHTHDYLGSGSKAADSNLLDGINSTSFLRSDADDTVNAGVTYAWSATNTEGIRFKNSSYNTYLYMGGWSSANSSNISRIRTSSGNLHMDSASNGGMYLNWYSGGTIMIGSTIESNSPIKSTIFYDISNTGYYVDPASTSNLNAVTWSGGSSANANTAYTHSQAAHAPSNANYTSSTPTFSEVYNNGWFRNNQTNEGMYNQATGNHWYSDGAYWNVGYSGTTGIKLRNGHNGTVLGTLYGETTGRFGLLDNDGAWAVRIQTGTSPLELRCNNNVEFYVYTSYTYSPGSSRAPIFYDSNNTGYYGNFASTSRFNRTDANDSRADIFYDRNNTGYYVNPYGGSKLSSLIVVGNVTASNFILSSDERKKTKIKDLTCNNINTNWKSFEFKNCLGDYRTGVIAQELEETHPEFVATDSDGFKSVKYIDLLIAKIAELEARLEKAGI